MALTIACSTSLRITLFSLVSTAYKGHEWYVHQTTTVNATTQHHNRWSTHELGLLLMKCSESIGLLAIGKWVTMLQPLSLLRILGGLPSRKGPIRVTLANVSRSRIFVKKHCWV